MSLFKRKNSCSCEVNLLPIMKNTEIKENIEGIKVLGVGCSKCVELENNVKIALTELGLNLNIEHIKDFAEISTYGIMSTPALVLNGKVVSYGKVLTVEEIKQIIKEKR